MELTKLIRDNIIYYPDTGEFFNKRNHSKISITKNKNTRIYRTGKKVSFLKIAGVMIFKDATYKTKFYFVDGDDSNYISSNIAQYVYKDNAFIAKTKRNFAQRLVESNGIKILECSCCGEIKELNEHNYQRRKDNSLGFRSMCRHCVSHNRKLYADTEYGKHKRNEDMLKAKFNIDYKTYSEMYDSQNGKCKICDIHYDLTGYKNNKLFVDHDHDSGKIRGLLCHKCNAALGMFMDNIDVMNNAIEYIKRNK